MWYKYVYEFLFQTDPLFNNIMLDWLLPAFIVWLLYDFSFKTVGNLYRSGVIRGKDIGSILHWGIRYGLMWITVQFLIILRDHWRTIVFLFGVLIIVTIIFKIFKIQQTKY